MKRTILSVALLIGVLVSNTSIANNDMAIVKVAAETELNVKALAGLKFVLTANNLQEKAVVTIQNANGEVLYTELVKKATYHKKFDLSYLSDGAYTFVVKNGTEVIEKPFNIETKRVATPKN